MVLKSILLYAFVFIFCSSLLAQKPTKIYGPAKEDKPIAYYEEQSQLWKKLTKTESHNPENWHYYYKAERALLQLNKPELWENYKPEFYEILAPILVDAKKHIGNKFEYHFLMGLNSEGDGSIRYLEKAFEIDPTRSEVLGWLFSYYLPKFETEKCQELAKQMLENNIYSDANLKWNYNALASIEKNGIIITNGDMDALPKYVLQYGMNVRTDVQVISKWLMASKPNHRKEIYNLLQLEAPTKNADDFNDVGQYADFLAADLLKRSKRPAYISAGTPQTFFVNFGFSDKMYVVGNALRYSSGKMNNLEVLEENYMNNYFMEYLLKNFQQHYQDDIVKSQMNLTYLPGLIILRNAYKNNKSHSTYNYTQKLINKIVEDSGREEEVKAWFGI